MLVFRLILIMVLASLLIGCAKPAATPSETAYPTITKIPPTSSIEPSSTPTSPYGELRVGLSSFSEERLDPAKGSGSMINNLLSPVFDFLINLDGHNPAPGIVESWEIAADGLSWTFHIRKGIKFQNNEELTADDVKFSYDRYTAKDAFYSDLKNMVASVDIVDDFTVCAKTLGVQLYLPFYMTPYTPRWGLVMPKDYIDQNGAEYFGQHPMGSGPFKYIRHISGDLIEYEAMKNHWLNTPSFKKLSVILVPEETTRVAMLKTGTLDYTDISIDSSLELEAAGFRTFNLDYYIANVVLQGAYQPEAAKMPIADIRVRQALSLAIDRQEIKKTFFYGKGGAIPPSALSEVAADIDIPYWMDYAAQVFRYDPVEATKLLKEAGYPDGFSIKLYSYTISGAPYLPKLAEVIQGYWQTVGVKAQMVPTDWGTYSRMRNTLKTPDMIGQAAMYRYMSDPSTPTRLVPLFHSQGSFTLFGKAMPELDKLMDSAVSEVDTNKRKEILVKAIKATTDSYTAINVSAGPSMAALSGKVDINFPKPTLSLNLVVGIAKHRDE